MSCAKNIEQLPRSILNRVRTNCNNEISLNIFSILNRADWPANADFNAMDVWQTACYLTVFLSVIEFCAVIFLTKTADWEEHLIGKPKVDIQNGKINSKVKIAFCINQLIKYLTNELIYLFSAEPDE